MANKKQAIDLETSLQILRHIDWFDGIHELPIDVNKKLLDDCADIIQEFIESDDFLPTKRIKSKPKLQKRQVSKIKKPKLKNTKTKQSKLNKVPQKIKPKSKKLKKNAQSFQYANKSSGNGYPCYPSAFPCFRSCGPINCPKNKLPMPRDLWYRIVYSQVLEQQLGSGEAFIPPNRSASRLRSPSKRKHKEDESMTDNNLQKNQSNSNNQNRQQTMNAAFSSTSTKLIKLDASLTVNDHLHKSGIENYLRKKHSILECNQETSQLVPSNSYQPFPIDNLEYIADTLPLQIAYKQSQSKDLENSKIESKENQTTLWNENSDKKILFTQSAHAELVHHPKIHRGISADATLEHIISLPSAPLNNPPNVEEIIISPIQQSINQIPNDSSPIDSSVITEHPLIDQLFEYYSLEDIPRLQLIKRLNRRLTHIRQTLKTMSSNDIEIKLKYKRDALVKKRQTPVQSLTKDERIAMTELELNVYEYIKALDEPSSKCFHVNNNDELETEHLSATPPALPSYDTVVPVVKRAITSDPSIAQSASTSNTVRPSVISQSTAFLSPSTQFSEKTESLISWTHPLLSNLMNMFEPLTSLRKAQIHKQLARRCEHICKKSKQLSTTQLQSQIDSKTKALQQNKKILQPNEDERLRIAELELCLFELEKEQIHRNSFD